MAEEEGAAEGFEAVGADDGVEGGGVACGVDGGGFEIYVADCGGEMDGHAEGDCFVD